MRRRMLAPVLQQFVGFPQSERFHFALSPSRGGNDVAEEMRPVGDPAHSAAGWLSPAELLSGVSGADLFSPDTSNTRSRTSAKLSRSSICSSSSSVISGCSLLSDA